MAFYCRIERGSSLLCTQYWFRILYVHAHYVIICNDQLIIEAYTKKIMDEGKQSLLSKGGFEVNKNIVPA